MTRDIFAVMSIEELWTLRGEIDAALCAKRMAEKLRLEERLAQLRQDPPGPSQKKRRRPYPAVVPKYRIPADPAETWSGRGRQPAWVKRPLEWT